MIQKLAIDRLSLQDLTQWLIDGIIPNKIIRKVLSHRSMNAVFPKDCLNQLVTQNYFYAMYKRALICEEIGEDKRALFLIEKTAFSGYSRAQSKLAEWYEKGSLIKQSYLKALNYHHQAYEKGNPYATYRLAEMFEKGLEVNIDVTKAFSLYKFASLRGVSSSQNRLGELYEQGLATIQNDTQAHLWFNIAALNGDNDAQKNIIRLDACG